MILGASQILTLPVETVSICSFSNGSYLQLVSTGAENFTPNSRGVHVAGQERKEVERPLGGK